MVSTLNVQALKNATSINDVELRSSLRDECLAKKKKGKKKAVRS